MKVVVNQQNAIGKISFGKIAKTETVIFSQLGDVDISQQQDGDTIIFDSTTNKYVVKPLEFVDGGTF